MTKLVISTGVGLHRVSIAGHNIVGCVVGRIGVQEEVLGAGLDTTAQHKVGIGLRGVVKSPTLYADTGSNVRGERPVLCRC